MLDGIVRCFVFVACCASAHMSNETKAQSFVREILSVVREIQELVEQSQQRSFSKSNRHRPHLTLSYAQSLDGKLAPFVVVVENGDDEEKTNTHQREHDATGTTTTASNFALSGPESLVMTHALRSIHDGILIGGRTMAIDNPRLTNRLWENDETEMKQPRPIVLDPTLRHICRVATILRAQRPLVFCSDRIHVDSVLNSVSSFPRDSCEIVPCSQLENGHLDLDEVMTILLERFGLRSVMVEGGASILNSLIDQGLFDCFCITIAPVWLGSGVGVSSKLHLAPSLHLPLFRQLGNDCVLFSCNDT